MLKMLFSRFETFSARPRVRLLALTGYYLIVILGLIVLYGKGDFSTPSFIYQNF